MNIRKKFIFIVISIFLINMITIISFAESPKVFIKGPDKLKKGEVFTVSANINDNPGVAAFLFEITWDPSQLEYIDGSLKRSVALPYGELMSNKSGDSTLSVNWYYTQDNYNTGTLFLLNFRVKQSAYSSSQIINLFASRENTLNINEENVLLETVSYKATLQGVSAKDFELPKKDVTKPPEPQSTVSENDTVSNDYIPDCSETSNNKNQIENTETKTHSKNSITVEKKHGINKNSKIPIKTIIFFIFTVFVVLFIIYIFLIKKERGSKK